MQRKSTSKITGSALGYALSFLLMIAMVCSGTLFLSSANKRIALNYELEEHLIFDNQFSLNYGASMQQAGAKQIVHPSGDTSIIRVKEWGMLRSVVAKTFHKTRNVQQSALIADELETKLPALYVPSQGNEIKLCGDSRIEGTIHVSKRGFKRGSIAKKTYSGDQLYYGTLKVSEKHLPPLRNSIRHLAKKDFFSDTQKIYSIDNDSIFSFSEKTSLYSSNDKIIVHNKLHGNLIIHTTDTLVVSGEARLENVILLANTILFEQGFQGAVQAIAEHEIKCKSFVNLNYPSYLILNELSSKNHTEKSQIYIGNNAQVIGGVLLMSQKPDFRKKIALHIDHAMVGGLIYNQGTTEVQGKIIGSLYSNEFVLNAGGGTYGGHIMDAEISSVKLPGNFIYPYWLKNIKPKTPTILSYT